jgi:beta-glucanase (GH16 family)
MPLDPRFSAPAHSRRSVLALTGVGLLTATGVHRASAATAAPGTLATEVLIDSSSLSSYQAFEAVWNYLYPWGSDHNGSARMVASSSDHSHVSLADGVLTLQADRLSSSDGTSSQPPNLPINYHSGAVHAKQPVLVDAAYPVWDVRGEFQAPSVRGTWPAFWITGVNSWPPESDILEYKGDARNWFNTYKNASGAWSNSIISVGNPGDWHEYRAVLTRLDGADVQIEYYLDGALMGTHRGANFVGQPMWIIVNLQMEGSSGSPGPDGVTYYRARNIQVTRSTG